MKRIGVSALQGSFIEHIRAIEALGHEAREIRSMADVKRVKPQAMILPGGESTTMMKFLEHSEFTDWLKQSVKKGMPVLATCAGLILLSKSHLNLIDAEVDRNAYGSQLDSFEDEVKIPALGKDPFHVICIRAPKIKKVGAKVKVLARHDRLPILIQQGKILGATFHPELTDDHRVHTYLIDLIHA